MKKTITAFFASLVIIATTVTGQTPSISKKINAFQIGAIVGESANTPVKNASITEIEALIEAYLTETQKNINHYWLNPSQEFDELIHRLWIAEKEANNGQRDWIGLTSIYSRPPAGGVGCAYGCWAGYYACIPEPEFNLVPNRCTRARDQCLGICIMFGGGL